MIIEVIAGEVGENSSSKPQCLNSVLNASMGADLHERIFTSCLNHLVEESVEGEVVGGRLLGRFHPLVDDVANGGKQSCLMSH